MDTAALLVDEVLPERPMRQEVLSLPFALRFLLARDPDVLGIVYRPIAGYNPRGELGSARHADATVVPVQIETDALADAATAATDGPPAQEIEGAGLVPDVLTIARGEHASRDHDIDATVASAALGGRVVGNRARPAMAIHLDVRGGNAETGEVISDADRAPQ